jgi:hypothetical protein
MDEQKWDSRLKVLTQFSAMCVAAVYVVGFMIISVYHVRYGIPEFNFLHSKIISAGVLFFVFLALPLWELAGIYDWIKIPPKMLPSATPAETQKVPNPESTPFSWHIFARTFNVVLFLGGSFASALIIRAPLFLEADLNSMWWPFFCFLISAVAVVAGVRSARRFRVVGLALVLITLPILAFGAWKSHDPSFQLLVLWFVICGVTAWQVLNAKQDPRRFLSQTLHIVLLNVLLPVSFFAAFIYPRIRPWVGGGAPVPIIVYCTDTLPFSTSKEVKAKLLDETDLGLYLLLSPDDKQAVFLPRSAVRAVKFVSQ